jgi:hypothetical protein
MDGIGSTVSSPCPGSPRPLGPADHAAAIVDWLNDSDAVLGNREAEPYSLEAVVTWLAMVSGLRQVDVDLLPRGSARFMMCKQAIPYEDAASDTTSLYQTELTRLMYAYTAVENTIRFLDGRPSRTKTFHAANKYLSLSTGQLPLHYWCILRTLEFVRDQDLQLLQIDNLTKKFDWDATKGETPAVVAMQVGSEIRHLATHGGLSSVMPPPMRGPDMEWTTGGRMEVQMAEAATTCLLLSIQLLFRHALQKGLIPDASPMDVDGEGWLPSEEGGAWVCEMTAEQRLMTLHLDPNDDPSVID